MKLFTVIGASLAASIAVMSPLLVLIRAVYVLFGSMMRSGAAAKVRLPVRWIDASEPVQLGPAAVAPGCVDGVEAAAAAVGLALGGWLVGGGSEGVGGGPPGVAVTGGEVLPVEGLSSSP